MRTLNEYDERWLTRMLANSARTESGCLVYQGFIRANGYAANGYQGKTVIVHRKVFEITKGVTLGRWELVCHTCDVRNCIEVSHLWLGTNKQNLHDARAKGRLPKMQQTACINGHDFTPENTAIDKMGWRKCRRCQQIRMRIYAGWTREQAEQIGTVAHGQRPVGATWARLRKTTSLAR